MRASRHRSGAVGHAVPTRVCRPLSHSPPGPKNGQPGREDGKACGPHVCYVMGRRFLASLQGAHAVHADRTVRMGTRDNRDRHWSGRHERSGRLHMHGRCLYLAGVGRHALQAVHREDGSQDQPYPQPVCSHHSPSRALIAEITTACSTGLRPADPRSGDGHRGRASLPVRQQPRTSPGHRGGAALPLLWELPRFGWTGACSSPADAMIAAASSVPPTRSCWSTRGTLHPSKNCRALMGQRRGHPVNELDLHSDLAVAFSEYARALRPGGQLIVGLGGSTAMSCMP